VDKVDNKLDSIDLTTAAGVLGLSVETLRKRLQRGRIAGFKAADGTWRVVLDKVDSSLDNAGQDRSAVVETLRDEVQFLRSQLQAQLQAHEAEIARRDLQIDRFQILLQQHQSAVKALPDHRVGAQDWMQTWMRMWLWWMPR
jgi:hypothetical protein